MHVLVTALCFLTAYSAPTQDAPPTVQLDRGTFMGTTDRDVNMFLGIKFADAPCVCLLPPSFQWLISVFFRRFDLPVPVDPYEGVYSVDKFGPACVQQRDYIGNPPLLEPQSEDCMPFSRTMIKYCRISDYS